MATFQGRRPSSYRNIHGGMFVHAMADVPMDNSPVAAVFCWSAQVNTLPLPLVISATEACADYSS